MLTNYLDRATIALRQLGISIKQDDAPVLALLDRVADYDRTRVANIASTLVAATTFNASLRERISGMDVSTRYAEITDSFDSIREDAAAMLEFMADGKLDLGERVKLMWMRVSRGSIPDRFEKIRSKYLEVADAAHKQIEIEGLILEAYQDYRLAMKSAEVDAAEMKKVAGGVMDGKRQALASAIEALDKPGVEEGDRPRLELARDEAQRALQNEDKRFQIMTDIADQLKTAYNAAELVFARLNQYHGVKERLYERAVTFFATNEVVLTGLAASFTSSAGMHEATGAINAMSEGISAGIESHAKAGDANLQAALKAGYGATIRVESVRALADALVEFQSSSHAMIAELRQEAAAASLEVETITENSKRRYAELLMKVN